MSSSRHQRRSLWIALAAIWGAFLVTVGPAEASIVGDRHCDSADLASCRAGRPEACNKGCRTTTVLTSSRTDTNEPAALSVHASSRTICIPTACRCSSSEPVASDSKPGPRTADDRSDLGEGLSSAWPGRVLSSVPTVIAGLEVGGRLKLPLYLLTTHLRF
jgi:hypothetical protein